MLTFARVVAAVMAKWKPKGKITINGKSSQRFIKGSLPAGQYKVTYELDGQKKNKQVTIKSDGSTKLCYDFNSNGPCSRDF